MKKILVVGVLIVAALVGYNYLTTGKLALIPSTTMSAQEKEIDDLVQQVRQATIQFAQAGRAAGMSGVDTTADAEAARLQVVAIEKRMRALEAQATEKTKAGLARLQAELSKAKQDLGIR